MSTPSKDWTIMIYMAGDNNLSNDMIRALTEIKYGSSYYPANTRISIFVAYDSAHPLVKTKFCEFPSGYRVEKSDLKPVEAIPAFMDWCVNDRKADATNYALILSGHTDGFQNRTMLLDENPRAVMSIAELRRVIETACDPTKGPLKKPLAVLGIDGCVMGNLEVAYELRKSADIWVASEGSIPNSGWSYRELTRKVLALSAGPTNVELAKLMVHEFQEFNKEYEFGGQSVDIAAIDLKKIEATGDELLAFSLTLFRLLLNIPLEFEELLAMLLVGFLSDDVKSLDPKIMAETSEKTGIDWTSLPVNERILRVVIASHVRCQTYMSEQCVDLRDFCQCVHEQCEIELDLIRGLFGSGGVSTDAQKEIDDLELLQTRCAAVIGSIRPCELVVKSAVSGADFQYSYGTAVFLPWTITAYKMAADKYEQLEFTRTKGIIWFLLIGALAEISKRPVRKKAPPTTFDLNSLGLLIDSKDDPPVSRGLDYYLNRFGQVKNFSDELNVRDGEECP